MASFATAEVAWPAMVGFGLLAGTGFGLGYAAATPAAVKWFPPEKKGLITGIVVAGFGLAPVYIAPLAKWLLGTYGISGSFRILAVAFSVAMIGFSQLIVDPPKPATPAAAKAGAGTDGSWRDMLRAPSFWSYYLQYAFAATAGLMIIGHLAKIVTAQSGGAIKAGFAFVALLAVFNAGGRVAAGVISDRIGRMITVAFVCILQAFNMAFFASYTTEAGFLIGSALVGFNYGACLSLFPATVADTWGTKSLGLNYGILFTAWGVGGVFGPVLAGWIADSQGSYANAYLTASVLLACATVLALLSYVAVSVDKDAGAVTIRLARGKREARPPPSARRRPDRTGGGAPRRSRPVTTRAKPGPAERLLLGRVGPRGARSAGRARCAPCRPRPPATRTRPGASPCTTRAPRGWPPACPCAMTRSSMRSQWTMIRSPSCSSAWESMVWSSLRMRPESEIFTDRLVWSTPERKRTSSGLKTWLAPPPGAP